MCHRRTPDYSGNSYLGIHLGIERLEAALLTAELQVMYTAVVRYDVDLPEYKTEDGVSIGSNSKEFHINPVMYIKALDMLFNCLESQGADLHSVAAIGGAAHHHGAIYWSEAGFRALCGLNPLMRLHEQLTEKCFAIHTLFWRKNSLNKQCCHMEEQVGDTNEMIRITGSKSFERITGPEIRKIFEDYPLEYAQTVRISLISSFLASLLVGNIASIEYSDGSRMNLLNIQTKTWSTECLNACAPSLRSRLMLPIGTNRLQGRIADYYVHRWNFRRDCMVVAATGSSSSMLATVKLDCCFLFMSLCGSDSIVMRFPQLTYLEEGRVMCHPTIPHEYMGLLCFRNGGQVRDSICRQVANGDWGIFNQMLADTPMGNDGHIAVHFDDLEYTPEAQGTLRWDKDIDELSEEALHGRPPFAEAKWEARAVVEGQLMHHRAIAASTGFCFGHDTKIIATGTCAHNESILQIVADVCNAPVYRQDGPEAHVMGAAYRARYAFYEYREVNCNCRRCRMRRGREPQLCYSDFIQRIPDNLKLVAEPTPGCEAIYGPLTVRLMRMCSLLASKKYMTENLFKYDSTIRPSRHDKSSIICSL